MGGGHACELACEVFEFFSGHQTCGDFGYGHAGGFGDERHGAGGAWIDLNEVNNGLAGFIIGAHGELHVHQSDDIQGLGERDGLAFDFFHRFRGEGMRRDDAGAVT